jgi:hypothetical protein
MRTATGAARITDVTLVDGTGEPPIPGAAPLVTGSDTSDRA